MHHVGQRWLVSLALALIAPLAFCASLAIEPAGAPDAKA